MSVQKEEGDRQTIIKGQQAFFTKQFYQLLLLYQNFGKCQSFSYTPEQK